MKVFRLTVDLDNSEQFQMVVNGNKDRMLVERIELRGWTHTWVRLHGHVVPQSGDVRKRL